MIPRSSKSLLLCFLVAMSLGASAQTRGLVSAKAANGDQRASHIANEARVPRREEVIREEALAGRRLTAEERAELRELLRREWASRTESSQTAETQPADRLAPGTASTPVRSQ